MSKSAANQKYVIRREMRLRRDKTAALLMPWFLEKLAKSHDLLKGSLLSDAAAHAVMAADSLIQMLDESRKDLAPNSESNPIPG